CLLELFKSNSENRKEILMRLAQQMRCPVSGKYFSSIPITENIFVNQEGLFITGPHVVNQNLRNIVDEHGNYKVLDFQADFYREVEKNVIIPYLANNDFSGDRLWLEIIAAPLQVTQESQRPRM